MNSQKDTALNLLATLQEIDRLQREKKAALQALETDLSRIEAELAQQRELASLRRAERDTLEARRREIERLLEDEEAKLKDRRMRLNRVRNEKELQALRREIEVGKESNQKGEEDLLRVMEAAEAAAMALADIERSLLELEVSSEGRLAEGRGRIVHLTSEVSRDREARTNVASSLDGVLLRKYEQIFDRRGGTAVVEARSGICQGCHMNLPPQLYNELQKSSEIRLCPNCHRILFWRPESSGDEGEAG